MGNNVKRLAVNKLFGKLILLDTFFVKSTSDNTFLSLRELVQLKGRLDKYTLGISLADMKAVCLFKFRDSPEVIEGYFKREGKFIAGINGVKLVDSLLNDNLNEEIFKTLVQSCIGSRQVIQDLDVNVQIDDMNENKDLQINDINGNKNEK